MNAVPAGSGNAGRPKRARTLTQTLGSIVLACEIVVVFLASLVAFGLDALAPLAPVTALIAGGVLFVALVVTIGMLRHRWGRILGWLLQAVIIATGILVPVMFFVGALFASMWIYAMITGRRVDHQKNQSQKEQE